jgi:endoribonuclease Dicer
MVASNYLYTKYPHATSGQLSHARSRVICNPTLSALSVKKLSLHTHLLANNIALSKAIATHAAHLLSVPFSDIVPHTWRFDPPKVLGDVFESLVGAVFVDCGFEYGKVVGVVEGLMREVLEEVEIGMPQDPVSGFMVWLHKMGCSKAKFV